MRFTFADGAVFEFDAESVRAVEEHQRAFVHGSKGGRPMLVRGITPEQFEQDIRLCYIEAVVKRFDGDGPRARNRARSEVVKALMSRHGFKERAAHLWVTRAIGRKSRMPRRRPKLQKPL